jgi:1,4-dihydroxy-2-naphthoate octaprenyltransferase
MTVTHLRFAKSTTRDLAERSRVGRMHVSLRLGEPEAWHTSNTAFLIALVAIAAMLTVFALVWR